MGRPRTLHQKIWDAHVVHRRADGTCLLYIDRHLLNEVTCAQAFDGLRAAGRSVRRPDLTLGVADHNVPTTVRVGADGLALPIADPESAAQVAALDRNAPAAGIRYFGMTSPHPGIAHVSYIARNARRWSLVANRVARSAGI